MITTNGRSEPTTIKANKIQMVVSQSVGLKLYFPLNLANPLLLSEIP